MSTNTKILPPCPRDTAEQAHAERTEICAHLGEIVPIEKKRAREHYERLAAELLLEGAARASQSAPDAQKSNSAAGK